MTKIQKVLTFFTTHTITAVVTASICLGGIATLAAQTTAPDQFKPSTVINNLFKNNKVQQTNPNTPLVADPNNDVVSYDPCNISIKYPKQLAGEKIIAVQPQDYNQPGDKSIPNFYGVTIKSQKNFDYDFSSKIENLVSVGCSTTIIPPADNNLNTKMTISELSELTGWFITSESKIEDIYTESQATAGPYRKIYFKFNNLFYDVNFVTTKVPLNIITSQTTEVQGFWNKSMSSPGVFGDQIQIQFNNVAKNIPNTKVQNLNGVPTSGELFRYDLELATTGVGLEWELTDSKTGDKYLIKGDELNKKADELLAKNNGLNNNQNSGVRTSGGLTYIFSGKVKDQDGIINTPNTYLITGIDKFETRALFQKASSQGTTITKENLVLNFSVAGPKPDTGFTMQSQNFDTYYFPYSLGYDYDVANNSYIFSGEVIAQNQNILDGPSSYNVKSVKKLDKGVGVPGINTTARTDSPIADPKNGSVLYAGGQKIYLNEEETKKLNSSIPPLANSSIEVSDMEIASVRFGGINPEGKETFAGKDGNSYLIPKEITKNLTSSNYGNSYLFSGTLKSRIDDLGPLWYEATSGSLVYKLNGHYDQNVFLTKCKSPNQDLSYKFKLCSSTNEEEYTAIYYFNSSFEEPKDNKFYSFTGNVRQKALGTQYESVVIDGKIDKNNSF